ncbi:hypothetical protein [Hymenobacter swuensis]|uniref:Uncharacterized protein n=1 Tax=Hymenobacter swuensis DY53 TaxID=1227739 RepID=W8F1L0_9BACT|nr:hypothetical protein [Hymenobacter swuensis]AHJ96436.1 hypothetical protein Hsw_0841 [Hymenobacter swuensis DY53]
MQLYSYWVRATLDCHDADGNFYHLVAYAGSDTSPDAARQTADQLLQARQARLLGNGELGEYPTGSVPLREQLIRRVYDPQGKELGAITRNRYGSLVLNAPRLMILDVDDYDLRQAMPRQPSTVPFSFSRFLRNLFNPPPPLAPLPLPDAHDQLQLRLASWLQLHPEWNFRLYRTRLGFRLIVTHQFLAPDSPEAQAVFAAMRTDSLYVRLCEKQDCYRARLSPKPWRIGWMRPAHAFPHDTAEQRLQQQEWEQQYHARSETFAVCQWVGEYGSSHVCPGAETLITLHDAACLGDGKLA